MSAGRQPRIPPPEPCPRCDGTFRPYKWATDRATRQELLMWQCDQCGLGGFGDVPRDPPPARRPERKRHLTLVRPPLPARRDGSQLRYLRSIPSAVFVPLWTGREVHRGMVRCPWHANGEERTPSLHIREDAGDWFCHPCGIGGGILDFCCELWGRPMPAGGREFARLIDEVDDALRRRHDARRVRRRGPVSPRLGLCRRDPGRRRLLQREDVRPLVSGEPLRELHPTATGGRQLYVFRDGIYRPSEEFLRLKITAWLGSKWKAHHRADETISYLMQSSKALWESPPLDRIATLNGVLQIARPDRCHCGPPLGCRTTLFACSGGRSAPNSLRVNCKAASTTAPGVDDGL